MNTSFAFIEPCSVPALGITRVKKQTLSSLGGALSCRGPCFKPEPALDRVICLAFGHTKAFSEPSIPSCYAMALASPFATPEMVTFQVIFFQVRPQRLYSVCK